VFVQSLAAFGLGGESRDVGLVIRDVSNNCSCRRIPAFPLFFVVLLNLPIGKVAAVLFEEFELMRHGTEALFGEELVWPEDLGLANEEVTSPESRVFC